ANLCRVFPEQALDFLSRVVGEQTQWPPSDLSTCLAAIRNATPELEGDNRYEQLVIFLRMRGQE
ncbi:hypothetical protein, partial [Pseudomonas sp. TSPC2-1]